MMNLKEDVLLKNYSTFKIGGPAKYFCDCENTDELKEVLSWARKNKKEFFILGGGSNVLFSDKGFGGVIIRIRNSKLEIKNVLGILLDLPSEKGGGEERKEIICGAGVSLGKLINFSIENDLTGLEWAVGIPGTVGGAVRGNAGAFKGEMKDQIESVKLIEINDGKIKEKDFKNDDCQFGYRNSIFKKQGDLIVWEIKIQLKNGNKNKSDAIIEDILSKRRSKQSLDYPSAGSVFKNPIVSDDLIRSFEIDKKVKSKGKKVPAGWLIEKCGLKGRKIGGAIISEKNSNFIINIGNATADDVVILISLVKQKVRNSLGVQLQEEIEIIV